MTEIVSHETFECSDFDIILEINTILNEDFTVNAFNDLVKEGFLHLTNGEKKTLYPDGINTAIALAEFLQYEEFSNTRQLLQLFCLTISCMEKAKTKIQCMGQKKGNKNLYNTMINAIILKLKEKIKLFHNNTPQ